MSANKSSHSGSSYSASSALGDDEMPSVGRGPGRGCRFCTDPTVKIDYKDVALLRQFVTERGKMIPRRITGLCATCQREVAKAIRRARMIALMPYTAISG